MMATHHTPAQDTTPIAHYRHICDIDPATEAYSDAVIVRAQFAVYLVERTSVYTARSAVMDEARRIERGTYAAKGRQCVACAAVISDVLDLLDEWHGLAVSIESHPAGGAR